MPATRAQRDNAQRRRLLIARLLPRRLSLREMAQVLEVQGIVNEKGKAFSHQTIKKDLDILNEQFLEESNKEVAKHKARLLHELEEIKRIAYKGSTDGNVTEKKLRVVLDAIKEQNKVLGLHAPEKVEVSKAPITFKYKTQEVSEEQRNLDDTQEEVLEESTANN